MDPSFTSPFVYWVGMETFDADADALAAFNEYYSKVHLPEVVANNQGFVRGHRFELVHQDPRGRFGPRWLAAYEIENQAGVNFYSARNDGPPQERPTYTPGPELWNTGVTTVWRMIWRRVGELGSLDRPLASVTLVGDDPGGEVDERSLIAFNEYTTDIHLPEEMESGGYSRAVRYELEREFLHPAPGAPRYCSFYESDAPATSDRASSPTGPGRIAPAAPSVWDERTTRWRLTYQSFEV